MKKLLSLLLALLCVMSAAAVPVWADEVPGAADFTDVDPERYYYDGVDYAVANGLMNGLSDTSFGPNDAMTRAMFVTVLYRLSGEEVPEGTETEFTDLREGAYYVNAVKWAVASGIVSGTTATTFSPDTDITREMMCVLMVRYAAHKEAPINGIIPEGMTAPWYVISSAIGMLENPTINMLDSDDLGGGFLFADTMSIRQYALSAVYACYNFGIVTGVSDTEFRPQGNATRGQVATVLMRFIRTVMWDTEIIEDGNVTTYTGVDVLGNVKCQWVDTHDENGNIIKSVYTEGDYTETSIFTYDEEGINTKIESEDSDGYKYTITMDPAIGLEKFEDSDGYSYEHIVDPETGNATYMDSFGWGYELTVDPETGYETTVFTDGTVEVVGYGENGLIFESRKTETPLSEDSPLTETEEIILEYTYLENGLLDVVDVTLKIAYSDGADSNEQTFAGKFSYSYDEEDNLTGISFVTETGITETIEITFPADRSAYTITLSAEVEGESQETVTVLLDQATDSITVKTTVEGETVEKTITFGELFELLLNPEGFYSL